MKIQSNDKYFTVGELIKALSEFPSDAPVIYYDAHGGTSTANELELDRIGICSDGYVWNEYEVEHPGPGAKEIPALQNAVLIS